MSEMNLIIFLCLFSYAMESLIISFKIYALFISSLWRYNRSQLTFPPETSFSELSTIRTFFRLWVTGSSHSRLQQKRTNDTMRTNDTSTIVVSSFTACREFLGHWEEIGRRKPNRAQWLLHFQETKLDFGGEVRHAI